MRLFLPLEKVEEQSDGTLRVFGVASSESRDSDNEITQANAIRKAIPNYLRHGTGALREMHQPIAAGKVDEISVDDDDFTRVSALVVDESSIKKVKHGVLKGFSVGGKVLGRSPADPREITACELVEISLVDRPANPDAVLTLWKADMTTSNNLKKDDAGAAFIANPPDMTGPADATVVFSFSEGKRSEAHLGSFDVEGGSPINTADLSVALEEIFSKRSFTAEQRRAASKSGAAMRGGRYPIENREDLHNAIRAVGRGKGSHAAIRAHIRRRAKALGAEGELPDSYKLAKNSGMDVVAHLASILSSVECLLEHSEWEQEMEKDSDSVQPEQIREWLTAGAELLKHVVEEEAAELMDFSEEEGEGEFVRISRAIRWMDRLSKAPRVRHYPEAGQNIRFHTGMQHGGEPDDEAHGTIEHVGHHQVTMRHEDGHLQHFIWPHMEGHFDKESNTWMMKRGARLSKEIMGHLQTAHDSLMKSGGVMCAAAEDEDLGKRVRALPAERREIVEALLKSQIKPADKLGKAAGDAAMNQVNPSVLSTPPDFVQEMALMTTKVTDSMNAALAKALESVKKDIAQVSDKVNQIASDPAPAKGVTRVVPSGTITKAIDVAGGSAAPRLAPTSGDSVKDAFIQALADGPHFTNAYDMLKPNA